MLKRIVYLFLLIILALSLVESVRNSFVNNVLFNIFYNIGKRNNNANIILLSGKMKYFTRNYDDAGKVYSYILQHGKLAMQKNAKENSYLQLGNCLYAKADYSNAAKAYYLTLKENPANTEALIKFVRINMAYGNSEQCIAMINAYIDKKDKSEIGYTELCAVKIRLENYSSARNNCIQAIKINKNYARAHYDYAELLLSEKSSRDAEKEFKLAKKLQPNIKSRKEIEKIMLSVTKKD